MSVAVVRAADYDDCGDIVRMLGEMWAEVEAPFAPPMRPEADYYVMNLIKRGFVHVVDAGKAGRSDIVGIALFDLVLPTWNPDPINARIVNNEFFIRPEYRTGGVGDKLLDEGKRLATEHNCPFFFGISVGGSMYALGKWLELKGFNPVGGNFYWVPDPAS